VDQLGELNVLEEVECNVEEVEVEGVADEKELEVVEGVSVEMTSAAELDDEDVGDAVANLLVGNEEDGEDKADEEAAEDEEAERDEEDEEAEDVDEEGELDDPITVSVLTVLLTEVAVLVTVTGSGEVELEEDDDTALDDT